jgi:cytochrome P450
VIGLKESKATCVNVCLPLYVFCVFSACSIGQNLAKLELQVVLATLLSRFRFSPGPELEQELSVAAATGQSVVTAVHALAGAYISLQPLSGQMTLRISARS